MKKLLVIGKVWPEPASSAAGTRMMQLLGLFSDNGFEVIFASASRESEYSTRLQPYGINSVPVLLNDRSFDDFVRDLQPAVVLFDRFTSEEQFGWRVAENCPDAIRVLDTEDLHFLRAARQYALKENRGLQNEDLHSEIAKREIAAIYRSDLSLIISIFEMDLLANYFKVNKDILHYLPLFAEPIPQEAIMQLPEFSKRRNFISIGNFLHEPNWDAVLFLKKEIWPLIRKKLPQAEMLVYGAYATQKVFELNDASTGFIIKGRAEVADEAIRNARVCLAPLRFGAGLKGKLVDAMRNGTPNVTTPVGAEGMQERSSKYRSNQRDTGTGTSTATGTDAITTNNKNSALPHSIGQTNELNSLLPWSGSITSNPEEFAEAACNLYTQESRWQQAQQNGFQILSTLFSRDSHEKDFIQRLKALQNDLTSQRLQNFTGAMLMQHFSQSTKYMSLWIEQKNKQQKDAE